MYDYFLTSPDEVSPQQIHDEVANNLRAFGYNASGGARKPGVSPSRSFGWTLRADFAAFYVFLAVGPPSLSCGALADHPPRIDTFRWFTSYGQDYASPSRRPDPFRSNLRGPPDLDLSYTGQVCCVVPFQAYRY